MRYTISSGLFHRRRLTISIFTFSLVAGGFSAGPVHGTIIQTASGLSSANVPVSFEADLTISGDVLTLVLINNSPGSSLNPNDVLGSYYFDIFNVANVRPTLTYQSGVGDVWMGNSAGPDTLQTANANIKAVVANDDTWQYKPMDATLNPFLGFGLGTVGNNSLNPNSFNGNIVGGSNYAIYKGDVTTNNLDGKLLVKEQATFTFTGLTGFTEGDIRSTYAFGMGTAPDSVLTPEPATIALLGIGLLGLRRRVRHR